VREQTFEQHLDLPPLVVWGFLTDLTNDCKWRPEIKHSELIAGEAAKPGARYRESVLWQRFPIDVVLDTIDSEPGCALTLSSDDSGTTSRSEYRFVEADGGTDMSMTFTMETHAAPRVMEPFVWRMVTGWLTRDFPQLERRIRENVPCD
jgi:hypothetical protein